MSAEVPEPHLSAWADALEPACAACEHLDLRHVRVLAETGSTQDAAWEASAGKPGWLVVAGRQTLGRGRLGRAWADDAGQGLALTLTLRSEQACPLRAGLAAHGAASRFLPDGLLGLRWPNDVVERAAPGRKLAGVLIEARNGVALLGIGVNVGQASFPPELHAVSMRQLGECCARLDVCVALVRELDRWSGRTGDDAAARFAQLDCLTGTRRVFEHDGKRHEGVVESLSPDGSIVVTTDAGRVELPAVSTSLVTK